MIRFKSDSTHTFCIFCEMRYLEAFAWKSNGNKVNAMHLHGEIIRERTSLQGA